MDKFDKYIEPKEPKEILVISGFSGVGKDTIYQYILENYPKYQPIISNTTRPMRDCEVQGREYNFLDEETFNSIEYFERREYKGWHYGTPKNAIDTSKSEYFVVIMDLSGLEDYIDSFRDKVKTIFLTVPNKIRKARMKERGNYSDAEFKRRTKDEIRVMRESKVFKNIPHMVENLSLGDTISEIQAILGNQGK